MSLTKVVDSTLPRHKMNHVRVSLRPIGLCFFPFSFVFFSLHSAKMISFLFKQKYILINLLLIKRAHLKTDP